jgi:hypothetical protein
MREIIVTHLARATSKKTWHANFAPFAAWREQIFIIGRTVDYIR